MGRCPVFFPREQSIDVKNWRRSSVVDEGLGICETVLSMDWCSREDLRVYIEP